MYNLAIYINWIFGTLTIVANVISIGLIAAILYRRFSLSSFAKFFSDKAVTVSFIATTLATVGSLIYSEIIGYEPCKLCWIQRIFMYPLVVILGMALWRKDKGIRIYVFVLSVVGAVVALYHYISQLGWNPLDLECASLGYSVSCAQTFVLQFGYITLPFMAFSAFVLVALSTGSSLLADKGRR